MKHHDGGKPLISVWVPAYFAGDYMSDTLDSILSQKTDYPYEIVINDDCSQDNTWEVICRYAEKNPDIIRAHRNETNLGLSANILATKRRCRGKYIVNLSGDDYWIDPYKIQRQADFLESHPEYIGVGTKVEIRYGSEKVAASTFPAVEELGEYTMEAYNRGINIPSHGFMAHNIYADPEKKEHIDAIYGVSAGIDDLWDPVVYLEYGKIFIMEETTSVYRLPLSKKGKMNFSSTRRPLDKALMMLEGYVNLESMQISGVDLRVRFCSILNLVVLSAFVSGNFRAINQMYRQIPERYRKPWYKSVGWRCAFSVWYSGFLYLRGRIRRSLKK